MALLSGQNLIMLWNKSASVVKYGTKNSGCAYLCTFAHIWLRIFPLQVGHKLDIKAIASMGGVGMHIAALGTVCISYSTLSILQAMQNGLAAVFHRRGSAADGSAFPLTPMTPMTLTRTANLARAFCDVDCAPHLDGIGTHWTHPQATGLYLIHWFHLFAFSNSRDLLFPAHR